MGAEESKQDGKEHSGLREGYKRRKANLGNGGKRVIANNAN